MEKLSEDRISEQTFRIITLINPGKNQLFNAFQVPNLKQTNKKDLIKILMSDSYQKVCLHVKRGIYQFLQNLKNNNLCKDLLEGTGKCFTSSLETLKQTLHLSGTFLRVLNSFG